MEVAIVKYNAGNIFSVVNALRRLGIEPEITDDPEQLQRADHVLFPGQGNAKTTMGYLHEHRLDDRERQRELDLKDGSLVDMRLYIDVPGECLDLAAHNVHADAASRQL